MERRHGKVGKARRRYVRKRLGWKGVERREARRRQGDCKRDRGACAREDHATENDVRRSMAMCLGRARGGRDKTA